MEVRFVGVGFVFVLFWGHIVGCADAGAGEVDFFVEYFGDAEVSEFDFIV